MNKKGLIGNMGMMILYLFIIVAAVVGITVYTQGEEAGYKAYQSVNSLTWNTMVPNDANNNSIGRFVFDTVNLVGKYSFEFSKIAANYGYTHPQIPWKLLLIFIILNILAPVLYYGFLFCVVMFLLIREAVLNRREKKELKKRILEVKSK